MYAPEGASENFLFYVLAFLSSNCLLWTDNLLQYQGHLLKLYQGHLLKLEELIHAQSAPLHKWLYTYTHANTSRASKVRAKNIWTRWGDFLRNIPQNWPCEAHCAEIFKKCTNSLFWDLETINEFIIQGYFSRAHIHYEYSFTAPPHCRVNYSQ